MSGYSTGPTDSFKPRAPNLYPGVAINRQHIFNPVADALSTMRDDVAEPAGAGMERQMDDAGTSCALNRPSAAGKDYGESPPLISSTPEDAAASCTQ